MAMSYSISKNGYATMRELEQWINSFNLPNIRIMVSPLTDDITIYNTDNRTSQRITRYALEDAVDPKVIILEAISNLMAVPINQLGDIIKEAITRKAMSTIVPTHPISGPMGESGATYVSNNTGPIWVSTGGGGAGGGGAIGAFNNWMNTNYNLDGTIMHDMPELEAEAEQQLQRDLMRNRLFNKEERDELEKVKQKVIFHFKQFRLNEEMSIPFKFHRLIIAGGCFASLINGEEPRDFDVFLLDDEYNRMLAKGVADSYKTEDTVTFPATTPVYSGANTVTGYISLVPKKNDRVRVGNSNYMNNDKIEQTVFFQDSKFQYITTQYKTREELVKHFDFRHCCVSYSFATDKLYITREVYDLIKSKKLVQNSDRIPAEWRFEKFKKRGWKHEPLDVMFL